jgi:hypothetical protein
MTDNQMSLFPAHGIESLSITALLQTQQWPETVVDGSFGICSIFTVACAEFYFSSVCLVLCLAGIQDITSGTW